jgi:hypothetical protein
MNRKGKHFSKGRCIPAFFKLFIPTIAFLGVFSPASLQAQATDISGIQHHAVAGSEEFNLILIKFDNALQPDDPANIERELLKYKGVTTINFSQDHAYVYIKYSNLITPNQILAVLDKMNRRGHYMEGGSPVYYAKDNNVYFIR